jgi:hypothetical protein
MPRPKDELLTVFEIARRFNRTPKAIGTRLYKGGVLCVSKAGKRGLYRLSDVEKAMRVTHGKYAVCPNGMVFVRQLSIETGIPASTFRGAISDGTIQARKVYAGGEQYQLAVKRSDAEAFIALTRKRAERKAERKAMLDQGLTRRQLELIELQRKLIGTTPPILSHDHEVCLQARRRLWEERGRKWRCR